jgi:hypothetical protein
MSLPEDERYPRTKPKKAAPEAMVRCVQQLSAWQEQGEIVFKIMEGQGIAAETSGWYHGNGDDDDLDMRTTLAI